MAMSVATVSMRLRGLPSITSLMSLPGTAQAEPRVSAVSGGLYTQQWRPYTRLLPYCHVIPAQLPVSLVCSHAPLLETQANSRRVQIVHAFWRDGSCSAIPIDSSVVDCVFQRITLRCLAHIAVEDGIHYEFLTKLLFLHRYIRCQLKLLYWPNLT